MKHFSSVALLLLFACQGVSDTTWKRVSTELGDIQEKDKRYRIPMDSIARKEGWKSKIVEELWKNQRILDSANLVAVDRLLSRYGYPPAAKVGPLSQVPFDVIRHADDSIQANYGEIIMGAGKNGDLRMSEVAPFYDQVLMMERVPQEYGTQVWIEYKQNSKTGERYDSVYLWPVRDLPNVNAKRLAAGLDSLSAHLRRFGIDPSKGYLIRKSGSALH